MHLCGTQEDKYKEMFSYEPRRFFFTWSITCKLNWLFLVTLLISGYICSHHKPQHTNKDIVSHTSYTWKHLWFRCVLFKNFIFAKGEKLCHCVNTWGYAIATMYSFNFMEPRTKADLEIYPLFISRQIRLKRTLC